MRGVLVGAFTLIVLQVLVSHASATNAVGGIATGIGGFVNGFIDPNTPAIPDHSSSSATTSSDTTPAPSSAATPVGSPPGNTGLNVSGYVPGTI